MTGDGRDYLGEIDKLVEDIIQGSGWVAAIEAARLRDRLAESDPELLDGWLHATAADSLRQLITNRVRQQRTRARRQAGARRFADAATAAADGDDTLLREFSLFQVMHVVDNQQTEKQASEMTGPEHAYVAEHTYQRSANQSLTLAAFHRAIAEKIGPLPAGEVMTEQEYTALYRSITRQA